MGSARLGSWRDARLAARHTTISRKGHLDGNVLFVLSALQVRSVCFALDRLLSMNQASGRIFGSDGALGQASDTMGGDLPDGELTSYPHDDGDTGWDFADVPVDYLVDVRASLR